MVRFLPVAPEDYVGDYKAFALRQLARDDLSDFARKYYRRELSTESLDVLQQIQEERLFQDWLLEHSRMTENPFTEEMGLVSPNRFELLRELNK